MVFSTTTETPPALLGRNIFSPSTSFAWEASDLLMNMACDVPWHFNNKTNSHTGSAMRLHPASDSKASDPEPTWNPNETSQAKLIAASELSPHFPHLPRHWSYKKRWGLHTKLNPMGSQQCLYKAKWSKARNWCQRQKVINVLCSITYSVAFTFAEHPLFHTTKSGEDDKWTNS